MGVGGTDHQSGQWDVGVFGQMAGHQMGQHRRTTQQVALHDGHRRRAALQVQHARPQPGAKALAVGGVGRVARLGKTRWRGDVHLGRPGQQRANGCVTALR